MRKEGCGLPAAEHSFRFKSPRTWITMYTCLHRRTRTQFFYCNTPVITLMFLRYEKPVQGLCSLRIRIDSAQRVYFSL